MPHYLFSARYTQAGIQGVMKEGGTSRSEAVRTLAASLGGSVEAQYWAFGEDDYFVIAELPDNAAAAAIASTVAASGAAGVRTTVLLTAGDIDEAAKRRGTYRAPGQ
jgi:uncharacterized protein with GYD domain